MKKYKLFTTRKLTKDEARMLPVLIPTCIIFASLIVAQIIFAILNIPSLVQDIITLLHLPPATYYWGKGRGIISKMNAEKMEELNKKKK